MHKTRARATHVREEEAPVGVVRVRVGLAELVVGAVVPGPHVDGVLRGHAVGQHEEDAQREARLVRAVRPQAVRARRHALQPEQDGKG